MLNISRHGAGEYQGGKENGSGGAGPGLDHPDHPDHPDEFQI